MTGPDLAAEYLAALHATSFADLQPLRDSGVSGPGHAIGPAYARIRLSRDRRMFEFDLDSEDAAFVIPIRSGAVSPEAADPVETVRHGPIVDLLAFSPAFPYRWARRKGTASWLGCIEPQYLAPDPVPIWRSPLRWLGNNCTGLVLLSRDRRERYRVLTCCESIIAEDEAHAEELRELLAMPWLAPPVFVRQAREVRRAA